VRLLLVEDDSMIGKAMRQGLQAAGFTVDWVTDGIAAAQALQDDVYDLALLDLGLPRQDGMAVLKDLRARRHSIPVLIVTARDGVADRIAGLNAGADDYVLKPFDLDELIARVRALLRRRAGAGSPLLQCGDLTLDPVRHEVYLAGDAVLLSSREFALLEALMQQPGAVLSRERLEDSMYGWNEEIGSNAVEVHLHHLRRKLGAETIRNVRGVGYKIIARGAEGGKA
jgi:two-component system, OmpR family, response regulator QseB